MIKVVMPTLYPLQQEIKDSKAKRKVIAAGRRVGKTLMASDIATDYALAGKRVLMASTTQNQADEFWYMLNGRQGSAKQHWSWLAGLIKANLVKRNKTQRILDFWNHGRIQVKTGKEPDTLRGSYADLIILDECAMLAPEAWYEVAAPMLLDRNGDAIFISTPKKKNWFYALFQSAKADDTGWWESWNFSTHENPYINKQLLQNLQNDMSQDAWRQEILAEFLENEGEVFKNLENVAIIEPMQPYEGRFVMGVDWGMVNDYSVFVVGDVDTGVMVDMVRIKGTTWQAQKEKLIELYRKWNVRLVVAEANAAGKPLIESLMMNGLSVWPFYTSGKTKQPLIENLASAFEKEKFYILNDEILKSELESYIRYVDAITYQVKYRTPDSSIHDDTVIATALLWKAINSFGANVYTDYDLVDASGQTISLKDFLG